MLVANGGGPPPAPGDLRAVQAAAQASRPALRIGPGGQVSLAGSGNANADRAHHRAGLSSSTRRRLPASANLPVMHRGSTTEPRGGLDRHATYVVAAYVAGAAR
jgi:hypothetical protein